MAKRRDQKVYITIGLPASGKTTWAKKRVIEEPGIIIRLNNDDIREERFGKDFKWQPKMEKEVKRVREARLEQYLKDGADVILDNTYLNHKSLNGIKQFILERAPHVTIEEVRFTDVPVHTCIDRDREREKRGERFVGAGVILKMARESGLHDEVPLKVIDWHLPWAMMCDLDGTLALFGNRRNPYDASNCHLVDEPNLCVLNTIRTYHAVHNTVCKDLCYPEVAKCFFFSGRTDKYIVQTKQFLLEKCGFDVDMDRFFQLNMRQEGDNRGDDIVKMEMYDAEIKGRYNIHVVFDDRPKVVRVWKGLGLPVFNVGDGIEF